MATATSRVFGLVRDQIFAALIGAGFYSDAYVIAFRIPNLLRDLFAEGALRARRSDVHDYEVKRSREDAWPWRTSSWALSWWSLGLSRSWESSSPSARLLDRPGFGAIPGKATLTILLTRIMWPFLLMIAVSALFMGILNVHREFTIPAFAGPFNLVAITFGVALYAFDAHGRAAVIGCR